MMYWKCLFFIFILPGFLRANSIEYMGISFTCDEGCSLPGCDYEADQLIYTFQKIIHEVFDDRWGLADESGSWWYFNPYQEDNDDLLEECLEELCGIARYDWEKSKGILFYSGKDGGLWSNRVIPSWDYRQTHQFELTHANVMREFSFFRSDLLFYAARKKKHMQKRLKLHHQNLIKINALQEEDFNGVLYDSYTDQVLRGTKWSFINGLAHEPHANYDGTYSRQIRFAQKHEEEEINSIKSDLEIPEHERCMDIINAASEEAENLLKSIFLYCLQRHQPEGIEFQAIIESFLERDLLQGIEHLKELIKIGEENHFNSEMMGKIHFLKGQCESEGLLYAEAILSLTEAIAKAPYLKEAYIERAAAYFELGEINQCLEDFQQFASQIDQNLEGMPLSISELSLGLAKGLPQGVYESGKGILLFLTDFVTDPILTSTQMVQAISSLVQLACNKEWIIIKEALAPEICQVVQEWDSLSSSRKGELIGFALGKYGSDILAPGALVKIANKSSKSAKTLTAVCKNLRTAEKTLALESIAQLENGEKIIGVMQVKFASRAEELGFTAKEIAQLKKFGTMEGEFSSITKNIPKNTIFTEHALQRAVERGVTREAIFNAIESPLKVDPIKFDSMGRPSQRFMGKKAEVVLNPETQAIISVNPTSTKKAEKLIRGLPNVSSN